MPERTTRDSALSSALTGGPPAGHVSPELSLHSEVFPSRSHTHALAKIAEAMSNGASCIVVTGLAGIGKTTLCRELAAGGDARTFSTAILDSGLRADDVLAQILRQFGLLADPSPGMPAPNREQLVSAIARFLTTLKPLGARAVVVLDDADRIDAEVISTLHEVSRVADPPGRALRLILVGDPSLDTRLLAPEFQGLVVPPAARVRLMPLDWDEVFSYVAHRKPASGDRSLNNLTSAVIDDIHAQSQGIPSRVNVFLTQAHQQASAASEASTARLDELAASPASKSAGGARWRWVLVGLLLAGAVAAGWRVTTRRALLPAAGPSAPPAARPVPPSTTVSPAEVAGTVQPLRGTRSGSG